MNIYRLVTLLCSSIIILSIFVLRFTEDFVMFEKMVMHSFQALFICIMAKELSSKENDI